MKEKYIDIIAGSRLFKGIERQKIPPLLEMFCAVEKIYKKNEIIFDVGDRVKYIRMVLEGRVYVIKDDYWGNRSILAEIPPSVLFGESYAAQNELVSGVGAVAAADARCLLIDYKKMVNFENSDKGSVNILLNNFIRILAVKNVNLTTKIDYLSQRRLRDKIIRYLSDMSIRAGSAYFEIPFSRQHMSEFLCTDRSALSKELCRLRDDGIIEFEKNHFKLKKDSIPESKK